MSLSSRQVVPRPSPEVAAAALRSMLPDIDWLLLRSSADGEWFRFPAQFVEVLGRLKIEKYAELYLRSDFVARLLMRRFFTEDDSREFDRLAAEGTESDLRGMMDEAIEESVADEGSWLIPKTAAERKAAQDAWDSLSEAEKRETILNGQTVWTAFVATFYNYLSAMVHRFPLTTLVQAAVSGDDDALVMAIQIDRTILTDLPYAVERYRRAARESDAGFFEKLAYRLGNPVIRGKIRFRQLWWALAMLDAMNLLDGSLTHSKVLDLLNEAGLDRYANRIESVEYLSKRIAEFRKFQARASGNLPQKSFSRHS